MSVYDTMLMGRPVYEATVLHYTIHVHTTHRHQEVSKEKEYDVMTDETRLLHDVQSQLSAPAQVSKVLPQSEGIKHCKEIIE